jgi:hypothetical protein
VNWHRVTNRAGRRAGLALLGGAMAVACQAGQPGAGAVSIDPLSAVVADSVRGVISIVGTGEQSVIVLAPADGSASLVLDGAVRRAMRAASGLTVVVAGPRGAVRATPGAPVPMATMTVEWFRVRAVDGVPALDGTLLERDGLYFLEMDGGRRAVISALPEPLRRQVGGWVYIAGPLDVAPVAYGVLVPPR